MRILLKHHPFAASFLGIVAANTSYLTFWVLRAALDFEGIERFPQEAFSDAGLILVYLTALQSIICFFFLINKNWLMASLYVGSIVFSVIILLLVGAMY